MRPVVLAIAVAAACASEQTPAPSQPERGAAPARPDAGVMASPELDAAAPPAPVKVPKALRIPMVPATPAPWLQPKTAATLEDPLGARTTIAIGDAGAIIGTRDYFIGVDRTIGVLGLVKRPIGVTPKLLTKDKPIIYRGGQFHRHNSFIGWMMGKGRSHRLRVPGTPSNIWDAAGDFIAIADGNRVIVSANGGRSFQIANVFRRGKRTITALAVRADGVMVAQTTSATSRRTYLSNKGRRWRVSPFHPVRIARQGAWIHDGAARCSAVLSRDGKRWLNMQKGWDAGTDWSVLTSLSDRARGRAPANHPSARHPQPPNRSKFGVHRGLTKRCPRAGYGTGYGSGGLGLQARGGTVLSWVRGTIGPSPHRTRRHLRFFTDGLCPTNARGSCQHVHATERPPHILVFDRETRAARVTASPCGSVLTLRSVNGLGVLVCTSSSGYHFYRYDAAANHMVSEGPIKTPTRTLRSFGVAVDGTMGLGFKCPNSNCGIALRDPVKKRWQHVHAKRGVAHRVLPGGRVLILIAEHDSASSARIGFALARVDRRGARPLIFGVQLRSPLLGFEVDDSGRILLRLEQGDATMTVAVATNGALLPIEK